MWMMMRMMMMMMIIIIIIIIIIISNCNGVQRRTQRHNFLRRLITLFLTAVHRPFYIQQHTGAMSVTMVQEIVRRITAVTEMEEPTQPREGVHVSVLATLYCPPEGECGCLLGNVQHRVNADRSHYLLSISSSLQFYAKEPNNNNNNNNRDDTVYGAVIMK